MMEMQEFLVYLFEFFISLINNHLRMKLNYILYNSDFIREV